MLYLNEKDLKKIGFDWNATIDNIELAVQCSRHSNTAETTSAHQANITFDAPRSPGKWW